MKITLRYDTNNLFIEVGGEEIHRIHSSNKVYDTVEALYVILTILGCDVSTVYEY